MIFFMTSCAHCIEFPVTSYSQRHILYQNESNGISFIEIGQQVNPFFELRCHIIMSNVHHMTWYKSLRQILDQRHLICWNHSVVKTVRVKLHHIYVDMWCGIQRWSLSALRYSRKMFSLVQSTIANHFVASYHKWWNLKKRGMLSLISESIGLWKEVVHL